MGGENREVGREWEKERIRVKRERKKMRRGCDGGVVELCSVVFLSPSPSAGPW